MRAKDNEDAVEQALAEVVPPSREESGCLDIHAYRSTRDARLFYIHSRWKDEAAFGTARRAAAYGALRRDVEPLIDHPLDVTRANLVA